MPPAIGERDELIQMFQNLIHNAIKYGKPGGHVWVTLSLRSGAGRARRGADAGCVACATTARAFRRTPSPA